jgi:transposase
MGRPAYDARVMLKIYVYGYMNRLNTTRVLRESGHGKSQRYKSHYQAPEHSPL